MYFLGDSLGLEDFGSRSRRGSRIALDDGDDDSSLSKFRRASRVPGKEIVEVTNAYKAKNELQLARDKKQRKSMRKKRGKKKNKDAEAEDED